MLSYVTKYAYKTRPHVANRGFTLIEIIIALAIVAIAVLAVAGAMNSHTAVAAELEQRIIASWVASNQIAEIRHQSKINKIKLGKSSDLIKMADHRWRVRVNIEKTDVEHVYLLTVDVKDDASREQPAYATLTTAISDSF